MWILRFLMLLSLVVWIGGIIFFAFVVAPTLFIVLPTTSAGNVVSPVLSKLHWTGLGCGVVFLLSSLLHNWRKYAQLRLLSAAHVLTAIMLLLTSISLFGVTRRMRELRAGPLSMDTGAAHAEFNRLHDWSTRLEGGTLLCGLVTIVLTARRFE